MLAFLCSRSEEVASVIHPSRWRPVDAIEEVLLYRRRGARAVLVVAGAGRQRTERAVSWLLESQRPQALVILGFGRACEDTLDIGDMVLATRLHHLEGAPAEWRTDSLDQGVPATRRLLDQARNAVELSGIDFLPGATLTTPATVRTSGLAEWLGNTYGVSVADRESYWAARASREARVPFLSIRSIAVTMEETLPTLIHELPDAPSGGRAGLAARYACRDLPGALRRYRALVRTRRSLGNLVESLIAQPGLLSDR